jgi:hypothetical protein
MYHLLALAFRKALAGTQDIATQVVVSVLATVCITLATNAYFGTSSTPSAPPSPDTASIAQESRPDPAGKLPAEGDSRPRPAQTTEIDPVFGPAVSKPSLTFASTGTPAPKAQKPREQVNKPAQAEAPRKPNATAQTCSGECKSRTGPSAEGPAPAARPVAPVSAAPAEAQPQVLLPPVPEEEERVRLLGIPLPGFVPSGEKIVKKIESLGSSISDLVDGS